ncbi:PREDICTED: protein very KIND [Dipodomys ordii]|uniref:Protein very KIND n=1 Tax=Dipodomys ordii TaxID=10020 RepID=A0A1S3GQ50_DIPOR|nr:PREDICTED: protein very KIND [Dipodomys ordii]
MSLMKTTSQTPEGSVTGEQKEEASGQHPEHCGCLGLRILPLRAWLAVSLLPSSSPEPAGPLLPCADRVTPWVLPFLPTDPGQRALQLGQSPQTHCPEAQPGPSEGLPQGALKGPGFHRCCGPRAKACGGGTASTLGWPGFSAVEGTLAPPEQSRPRCDPTHTGAPLAVISLIPRLQECPSPAARPGLRPAMSHECRYLTLPKRKPKMAGGHVRFFDLKDVRYALRAVAALTARRELGGRGGRAGYRGSGNSLLERNQATPPAARLLQPRHAPRGPPPPARPRPQGPASSSQATPPAARLLQPGHAPSGPPPPARPRPCDLPIPSQATPPAARLLQPGHAPENVSLADVLSLRDRGLSEQEAWAVCLECSLSMRSVVHAALFQTLCITPDTLAFNTSGNVCFMEQLSDDPEGAFVPPEFDLTGNTFEAHIYSLGATLRAALEFVSEPQLELRLSPDLETLLGQMQAEDPRDRPDLQSIIALCEEKVRPASSCRLCRSLSATGRRVLSIESFGAFQDINENAWRGRPAPRSTGPKRPSGDFSTDPEALSTPESLPQPSASGDKEGEVGQGSRPSPMKTLLSVPMKNGEGLGGEELASLVLDARCPLGELDRDTLKRSPLRKVQTFPRLLMDGPEASTLCLSLASSKKQLTIAEVFPPDPRKGFLEGKNGLSSFKTQPKSRLWLEQEPKLELEWASRPGCHIDEELEVSSPGQRPVEIDKALLCSVDHGDAGPDTPASGGEGTPEETSPQTSATAPELSLSLKGLLSKLGRPLRECELWALCLSCLRTLQGHAGHPACLCLDNVLVATDGAVLFGPPPAQGGAGLLVGLAPPVPQRSLLLSCATQASVYCVAAVLWTAAKFSIPRNHKLALTRRLKSLLLDMARRCAQERPSAAEAIEVCGNYLLQRGMDSKKILAHLRASTCKVHPAEQAIALQSTFSVIELKPCTAPASETAPGFRPIDSGSRRHAGPGSAACREGACERPAASTCEATLSKPSVLAQDTGVARHQLTSPMGTAEMPAERSSPLDRESTGTQAVQGLLEATRPDQPAPDTEPEGAAVDSAGASVPRGSSPERPCPAGPVPPSQQGVTPGPAASPTPTLPQQAPALPPEHKPEGQAPSRTSPPAGALASRGPHPPRKPPRSKAAEPEVALPGVQGPLLAAGGPNSPRRPESHPDRPRPPDRKLCPSSVDTPSPPTAAACPSLQEAMRLIQEEFAFDGYLDNGLEALIMGEYIYALKDLTFATFCGAISEKFCDLYWNEQLLQNLFKVVNRPASPPESAPDPQRPHPQHSPGSCSIYSKRPSPPGLGDEKPTAARDSGGPCSPSALSSRDPAVLLQGNFEVGFRPQKSIKAAEKHQPEAEADRQQGPGPEPAGRASEPDSGARLSKPEEGGRTVSPGSAEFRSCSPGWSSAFYEADCFGADVYNYVKDLGWQKTNGHLGPEAQSPELEQQLMIEKRNYRKTLKFYQKLLQKEKRGKGSEVKTMLCKLRGQLEEMKSKVQFLGLVRKYLQVTYAERWGVEPCALPVIVNIAAAPCDTLDFSPLDESSSLIFYNVNRPPCGGGQKARVLQAGTPLGLMAYLYSSGAFLEGYVQQFLYTFRYFCTPQDFLHFLLDRISSTLSRAHQDPTSTFAKIYRRSLCVLQAWVEDCYTVDFTRNAGLLGRLEDFISSKILPLDGSAEHLLDLLEVGTDQRAACASPDTDLEDPKQAEDLRPFTSLCKKLSEDGASRKSFSWKLPRGNGLALPHKERQYTIASALPKPCFFDDFYGPYAKASEKGPYFLTGHSTHQLFTQLTLLQQELFQKCHPVHFLNSRALGVTDKSAALPRANSSESLSTKTCSLFLPNYIQDKYLVQLLRHGDDVSTWVAAEIVTSSTSKLQVNLLSKFLLIAKCCYEQRNFATAMQILGGLEHPSARQCPAWRILPAKIAEVMEELKAVEVFLKSDSLCLMEGRRFRAQPTLPSARLLAMHIQQLETGGFTMTNGAHRWSKLRCVPPLRPRPTSASPSEHSLAQYRPPTQFLVYFYLMTYSPLEGYEEFGSDVVVNWGYQNTTHCWGAGAPGLFGPQWCPWSGQVPGPFERWAQIWAGPTAPLECEEVIFVAPRPLTWSPSPPLPPPLSTPSEALASNTQAAGGSEARLGRAVSGGDAGRAAAVAG